MFLNDIHEVKNQIESEGFCILKNLVSKDLINNFSSVIEEIEKDNNKYFFELYAKHEYRPNIYKLMQNMAVINQIACDIDKQFKETKFYNNFSFKAPCISSGLLISVTGEDKFLNPLHQDIYAYNSSRFLKFWIPMTQVDEFYGSLALYKGSHKLGYVAPSFKAENNHYPSLDEKIVMGFEKIVLDMPLGDGVIFDPLILHKSIKNVSETTRFTVGLDLHDLNFKDNFKDLEKYAKISKIRASNRIKP
jgi:ectoine hydroxylase-related dioxygenase (phytanoyl-CoA dioxygenase family)